MSNRKAGFTIAAAVVTAAFSAAAFAQSDPARTGLAQSGPARSEAVLAFRDTGDSLRIRVSTGGCTTANDFNVNVDRSRGQAHVTLVRVVPDNCKGDFPEGTEIAFSYEAAGVQPAERVQLMNRVAPQR
jgi:hypothetical protein